MTTERTKVLPLPLDSAPEVNALLERLNLGGFTGDDLTSYPGRNDIWAGTTRTSDRVFVKRITTSPDDARTRLRKIEVLDSYLRDNTRINSPRVHSVDADHGLVVFEMLDDAETASELAAQDLFTEELAEQAGAMLGALHSCSPPEALTGLKSEVHDVAQLGLTEISLRHYAAASAGELEMWSLLQHDQEVVKAVSLPRDNGSASTPATLVHGDLRLDQFLIKDDTLYLTDWEECRVDDPARDIGAFAGEWLYRGVLFMAMSSEDPVGGGARRFELLRPYVERFWSTYRDARPEAASDSGLTTRATAYAGWHLFDRAFASAQQESSLSPLQKAAAGVGRQALLSPADFVETIGFGDQ